MDGITEFLDAVYEPSPKKAVSARAVVSRIDRDGRVWVHFDGGTDETPVHECLQSVKPGDSVAVTVSGGRATIGGNATDVPASSSRMVVVEKEADRAAGYTDALEAASIKASDIAADHASIAQVKADYVKTSELEAESARIDDLEADTADIGTIRANSAKVANLTAAQLEADHATVANLDANYAKADMANVNNAWISRGTIKDGAISNAMINDLSASKLTAGTINGSNINVTNLNADNITAGTLNGQRIGDGSLSLDKLSEDVYTEAEVDAIAEALNDRIDGAIETWTGTEVPTLSNLPASGWTDAATRDSHVGDVYFVVNPQSQQNGYNYRFTKTGSNYSWQLIKDNDVTQALQRLTAAEGKIGTIETFDTQVSSFMTSTDSEITSLKTRSTNLETRMTDAEGDISTKVETSVFNELSQTVDGNTSSITSLSQKTETLANPSLAPFFERSTSDIYNATTNPRGFWVAFTANTFTDLEDGWVHVEYDNTEGTADVYIGYSPMAQSFVKPSTTYTVMIEIRNSTPGIEFFNFSAGSAYQISGTNKNCREDGVYHGILTSRADLSTCGRLMRSRISILKGYSVSFDFRISLYEGEYTGPHKPWVDIHAREDISATVNSVKQTADANTASITNLTTTVGNNKTEIESRASAIEQDLSGFKTTVANTYATQDTVSGVTERVSQAETDISQNAAAIALRATKAEVQNYASNTRTGGLGMRVNANAITGTNNGECFFHGFDSDYAPADVDGWVVWNGARVTIPKGVWINPNKVIPYNVQTFAVYRTSNEAFYGVYWDATGQKWRASQYNGSYSPGAVADFTWAEDTDIVLACYVEPSSEGAIANATLFDPPKHFSELSPSFMATSAELKVANDSISTKVEKNGVISSINQSSEQITIDAERVNVAGAAIFTSGRLSQSSLDSSYDAAGSAATAKSEAISAAATDATSKANAAQSAAISAAATDASTKANAAQAAAEATASADATSKANAAQAAAISAAATDATAKADAAKTHYGTCSTEADVAAKVVACSTVTSLYPGLAIVVRHTTASSAATPTLNVNSLGAKGIYLNGANVGASNLFLWGAGTEILYVYSGSKWIPQTTQNPSSASCTTSASTAEKVTSAVPGVIRKGTVATVVMTNANTAATPTLNLAGTGALPIKKWTTDAADLTADDPSNWKAQSTVQFTFSGRNWYIDNTGNKAAHAADDAAATAASASTTANAANYREQTIYRSAAAGTASMAANTTWVTASGDTQNAWTTKRPTYASAYPVLFVAVQRQSMAQSDGTECSCTTPVKDDTTTVIDGGHITTGTIDASAVTVDNINASNIKSGTLDADRIGANSIDASKINVSSLTIGQSQVTNLTTDLAAKAPQTALDAEIAQRKACYGTCATAIGTATKVVVCDNFSPYVGMRLVVDFTNGSTSNAPALQIKNSGGTVLLATAAVWCYGAPCGSSSAENPNPIRWGAGAVLSFVWDGTVWNLDETPPSYSVDCDTAASTRAKAVTVPGALIIKGTTVTVVFANANTHATSSVQLNVSGTGAYPIYRDGVATSSQHHLLWDAGETMTFVQTGKGFLLADSGTRTMSENAAKTATSYVTDITGGGVMVHPDGDSTTGWKIADALELLKSGVSYFKAWLDSTVSKIRIGLESSIHVVIDDTGMEIFTNTSTSVAEFGSTARLGATSALHSVIDGDSFDLFTDSEETESIFHVGYPTEASITDTFIGDGSSKSYTLSNVPSGTVEVYVDDASTSAWTRSGTTLTFTTAPGKDSVVIVRYTTDDYIPYYSLGLRSGEAGEYSVAEGYSTTSSGARSHAEGQYTKASGYCSHAEGSQNHATGTFSHVEGGLNKASGNHSHAEGYSTRASGNRSHAQNRNTIAASEDQTALGRSNVEDSSGSYAVIIGNGPTDLSRSNALTVDWSGNVGIAGDVQDLSGNNLYADASHSHAAGDITSGTLDEARIPTLSQTKVTPIYYQAAGASGSQSLAAGTVTQIALVATGALASGSGLSIASGGIKVATAGRYRITGSAYVTGASGQSLKGCYIKKAASSGAYSAATEIMSATVGVQSGLGEGGVVVGPKIVQCAANDVIYLAARSVGAASSCAKDNAATYLLVERLS